MNKQKRRSCWMGIVGLLVLVCIASIVYLSVISVSDAVQLNKELDATQNTLFDSFDATMTAIEAEYR